MAGRRHRKSPVPPTREATRANRVARLLATGFTPEQRAAAAFDALRIAARHSPEKGPAALEDAAAYIGGLTAWIAKGDSE